MSDSVAPPRPNEGGGFDISRLVPQRSFGLKLILVCTLALMMAIPAVFVWALLYSRSTDANRAIEDVAQLRGGIQELMGPAVTVPFERDVIAQVNGVNQVQAVQGRMVLYADTGTADAKLETEVRRRGLHDVPVYTADAVFKATFNPSRIAAEAPSGARLKWSEARVYMSLGDLRGAKDVRLTLSGRALDLAPVEMVNTYGGPSGRSMVSAPLGWIFGPPPGTLPAEASLRISGAQRISLAAFAKDTVITMSGDWASPSFDGGFLPDTREVTKEGFTATWRIPFLARGAPGAGPDLSFDTLINSGPGASLLDTGNPYQSVERALKYAPMFIGLVFLTYFLFEATSGVRAHPAQYVLVGLAQTVFYMLLLSISEVAGFNPGFLIAATAMVLTLSFYAGSVFGSRAAMLKALVVFTTLYALIYTLMRQEDYALLVGSVASFLAIAGTMWMTRKLDWYGVGRSPAPQPLPQG
ncbi:MAG: cell envelope integrity protein CreD [Hyphomonadaceae bacterium]|nr:cell envelope integrity protein CreD [Hyphomonadaceae bacterium]